MLIQNTQDLLELIITMTRFPTTLQKLFPALKLGGKKGVTMWQHRTTHFSSRFRKALSYLAPFRHYENPRPTGIVTYVTYRYLQGGGQ